MRWWSSAHVELPGLSLALAASLAACAPASTNDIAPAARNEAAPPGPAAHDSAYAIRGVGQSGHGTDWSAVILDGRILLDSPTSAGWASIEAPEPRIEGDRRIYRTRYLTLTIEAGACALATYRIQHPDRVTIDWDAGRFQGCGGPRRPAAQIAGTWWELLRIGSESAPAGRAPAAILHFGPNGGLGGTLSCNDGGIRRSWTDAGFAGRADGFEQTAVGCNDPAGEVFGMRFWTGMMTATAWRRTGDRLTVIFADGTEAELRYLL